MNRELYLLLTTAYQVACDALEWVDEDDVAESKETYVKEGVETWMQKSGYRCNKVTGKWERVDMPLQLALFPGASHQQGDDILTIDVVQDWVKEMEQQFGAVAGVQVTLSSILPEEDMPFYTGFSSMGLVLQFVDGMVQAKCFTRKDLENGRVAREDHK